VNTSTAQIRDTGLLSAATVLGVVLTPVIAFVGLPIAAAGIAGLAYRGRALAAAVASALGIVAVALGSPTEVIMVAPALTAVLLAVALLPKVDSQIVGAVLTFVFGLAGAAQQELFFRAQGTTVSASMTAQLNAALQQAERQAGPNATAESIQQMRDFVHLLVTVTPTAYFAAGLLSAVGVIAAIAWAARRSGRAVNVPRFSRIDLSPHVLWPFVAGLFLLAASYSAIPGAAIVGAVGLNLVLCVRMLFLLQGMSVAAGVLDRTGVGLGGRILALAALAALDAFTLAVSFAGLLDFWINFRRLPRDGVTPVTPAPWASDRKL
jgi:hypothetical protein